MMAVARSLLVLANTTTLRQMAIGGAPDLCWSHRLTSGSKFGAVRSRVESK